MDGFYRGVEASLLALGLALGLAAATVASLPATLAVAETAVTLPMIEVFADITE